MARNACRSLLVRLCDCRVQTQTQTRHNRWYMTGMRRSALKETLLRALRTQIQQDDDIEEDGISHSQPCTGTLFNSFSIDPRVGEHWVRLTRSDHLEDITIDATMFDGSAPGTRSGDIDSDERLHVTLAVEVSKKDSHSHSDSDSDAVVMQFLCSAWPDAMDVDRVFAAPPGIRAIKPYLGPRFKNLDDEMQKAVQDYLEERGINDELAAFLHKFIANKARTEHIRWLRNIETYMKK